MHAAKKTNIKHIGLCKVSSSCGKRNLKFEPTVSAGERP